MKLFGLLLSVLAVLTRAAASRTYFCTYGLDYNTSHGLLGHRTDVDLDQCMAWCDSWGDDCVMAHSRIVLFNPPEVGVNCDLYSVQHTAGFPRLGNSDSIAACRVGLPMQGYQCRPGYSFDTTEQTWITDTVFDDLSCAEHCKALPGCTASYVDSRVGQSGAQKPVCHMTTADKPQPFADGTSNLCMPANKTNASPSYTCYYGFSFSGGDLTQTTGSSLQKCLSQCHDFGAACVLAHMDYSDDSDSICYLKSADYDSLDAETDVQKLACEAGPPPAGYQCIPGQRFDPEAAHAIQQNRASLTDAHCAELCNARSGCTGFYVGGWDSSSGWTCYLATAKFDAVQDKDTQLCVPHSAASATAAAQTRATALLV